MVDDNIFAINRKLAATVGTCVARGLHDSRLAKLVDSWMVAVTSGERHAAINPLWSKPSEWGKSVSSFYYNYFNLLLCCGVCSLSDFVYKLQKCASCLDDKIVANEATHILLVTAKLLDISIIRYDDSKESIYDCK